MSVRQQRGQQPSRRGRRAYGHGGQNEGEREKDDCCCCCVLEHAASASCCPYFFMCSEFLTSHGDHREPRSCALGTSDAKRMMNAILGWVHHWMAAYGAVPSQRAFSIVSLVLAGPPPVYLFVRLPSIGHVSAVLFRPRISVSDVL